MTNISGFDFFVIVLVALIFIATYILFVKGIRYRTMMLINSATMFCGAVFDLYVVGELSIASLIFWIVVATALYIGTTWSIEKKARRVFESKGYRW